MDESLSIPGVTGISYPDWGFPAVQSDTANLIHPNTGKLITSRFISLSIASEAVKVRFANGVDAIIDPGVLPAGVKHRLSIIRVWDTGTGATVKVFIWP